MTRLAMNIVGFQVAWWTCVLSARADAAWIGLAVTAVFFILHVAFSPARAAEMWFIPLAAALGYAADTLATLLGALQFEANPQPALPAPLWIAALWLAFSTTLNTTFSWLHNRLALAALVGAVSGPLSYAAGSALNVVSLPSRLFSVILLAVIWGVVLPILVMLASRVVSTQPAAGKILPSEAGGAA